MADDSLNQNLDLTRFPIQIFTTDFLNNPIRFDRDKRFDVESMLRELDSIVVAERDLAEFVVVDIGLSSTELYPVTMYTTDYNRDDVTKKINKIISAFREQ